MGKPAAIPGHDTVAMRLAEKTMAAVVRDDVAAGIDAAKAEDVMVLLAQIKLIAHDGILLAQVITTGHGSVDDQRELLKSFSEIKGRLIQAGQVIK